MDSVDKYRKIAATLTRAEFLAEFPSPVFVIREIVGGRLTDRITTPDRGEPDKHAKSAARPAAARAARIKSRTLEHLRPDEIDDPRSDDVLVTRRLQQEFCAAIRKGSTTPRDQPITIGRFTDADVVLNDYTVSKVHAWFTIDPMLGHYRVSDAGSTNGTRVGERRLESNKPTLINSGDRVTFGRLICDFLTADDFHRWLTVGVEPPKVVEVSLRR